MIKEHVEELVFMYIKPLNGINNASYVGQGLFAIKC